MRLLLAGPDGKLAAEMVSLLSARRLTFDHVPTGEDSLMLARQDEYDALLFDAGMADMTGQEFVRRLRAGRSQLPAIALVCAVSPRDRARLLDAGADDVVGVPCDAEELAARIRAVARRVRGFTQSVLRCGTVELHLDSRSACVNGRELRLSPSEYRVLQQLLMRKGTLVTKAALLDALYNDLDEPEVKSIDVLMHRLRKRLTAGGADGVVSTVWGAGYIMREPPAPAEAAVTLVAAMH
jgi:two-component system cell cycle response regulator CtrA